MVNGTAITNRWQAHGVFERLFSHFSAEADLENLRIDSTVVRAHPCSAGTLKKVAHPAKLRFPGAPAVDSLPQALGRSRGGFTTKVHIAVDGLGNPLRFILTGGQVHDVTQACSLVEGFKAQAVLVDKGYASFEFRRQIEE